MTLVYLVLIFLVLGFAFSGAKGFYGGARFGLGFAVAFLAIVGTFALVQLRLWLFGHP